MAAKKTTFTATFEGQTETRSSATKIYTHAAVYRVGAEGNVVIGSWHTSEALARKGSSGFTPIAVVAVTVK